MLSNAQRRESVQEDSAEAEEGMRYELQQRFHAWLVQEIADEENSLRSSIRFLQDTRFLAHASMAGWDKDYTVGLNWGAMALNIARRQERLDALRRYDLEIDASAAEVTLPVGVPGSAISDLAHRVWDWYEKAEADRKIKRDNR